MPCIVEIISVGNELLLGNTVNTNASWLATQITSLGGRVGRITTVGDQLGDISNAVKESIRRRPDFLITTGGIGPTFDDMTLRAVARAFGLRMRLDKTAVTMIREHYRRRFPSRRISLTKARMKMAVIPSGGIPMPNPVGTAPAIRLCVPDTEIFCLPGVPEEARAIFEGSLSQVVRARAGGMRFLESWMRVHGIMESSLAPIIDRAMRRWSGVYIKSHPRRGEVRRRALIELHFSILSANPRKAEQRLLDAMGDITRQLAAFRAATSTKIQKA